MGAAAKRVHGAGGWAGKGGALAAAWLAHLELAFYYYQVTGRFAKCASSHLVSGPLAGSERILKLGVCGSSATLRRSAGTQSC